MNRRRSWLPPIDPVGALLIFAVVLTHTIAAMLVAARTDAREAQLITDRREAQYAR
jgi:hypothetical protein